MLILVDGERLNNVRFDAGATGNRFNIDPGSSYNPATSTFTGELSTFTRGREQATLNDVDSTGLELQANIQPWRDAVITTGVSLLKDESSDTFSFESFAADGQTVTYGEQGVATTPDTEYPSRWSNRSAYSGPNPLLHLRHLHPRPFVDDAVDQVTDVLAEKRPYTSGPVRIRPSSGQTRGVPLCISFAVRNFCRARCSRSGSTGVL